METKVEKSGYQVLTKSLYWAVEARRSDIIEQDSC